MDDVEQGESLCRVKLGHEIDVRVGVRLAAGDGAEEPQMGEPGCFQLRFMLPEDRKYAMSVHAFYPGEVLSKL